MIDKEKAGAKPRSPRMQSGADLIDVGPSRRSTLRTTAVVLALTIAFHAAAVLMMPERLLVVEKSKWGNAVPRATMHAIHLVPPPETPPEPVYVPATDAPENKPDETNQFSSKDQQASQIVESEDKTGQNPEIENGEDEQANALQTGAGQSQPVQIADVVPPSKNDTEDPNPSEAREKSEQQEERRPVEEQRAEPAPIPPSSLASDTPQTGGEGYVESRIQGEAEEIPEKAPQERVIPATMADRLVSMEVPKVQQADATGMRPRERPRINISGPPPTVLRKTPNGLITPNGMLAYDSKLSEYGDYLARMFEVIGVKWHGLNENSTLPVTDSRTYVVVSFIVTAMGQIEQLQIVESNASQSAQWRCKDAIMSNAPYNEWTDQMRKLMGERQIVTVKFMYR